MFQKRYYTILKQSLFSNEFLIIKTIYKIDKSILNKKVSLQILGNLIYDPKYRLKWDKSITEFEIYDKKGNSMKNKGCLASPIFFISEREYNDKRVEFIFHNTHYSYSSNIKGEENCSSFSRVRINNLINALSITENESHFLFIGYNQFDPKLKLPEFIFKMTIPIGVVKWYSNLIQMINSTDLGEICT